MAPQQVAKQADDEKMADEENPEVTYDALLAQIEKYVKLESNKKATISTIGKLIKFTKEQKACYLCKQAADRDCITKIERNFSPDVSSFDSKIQAEKEALHSKLNFFKGSQVVHLEIGGKKGACSNQEHLHLTQMIKDVSVQYLKELGIQQKIKDAETIEVNNLVDMISRIEAVN